MLTERRSQWLGAQGDELVRVPCRVVRTGGALGVRGPIHVYKFQTPEGDKLTWFSSREQPLALGDTVALSGWIKRLEEYAGEQVTVVAQCRVERVA